MDAIRDAREVSQRRPRGELNPPGGALHMKFSRDSAILRIPAPHLLKQGQLQLAGASFRDKETVKHGKAANQVAASCLGTCSESISAKDLTNFGATPT